MRAKRFERRGQPTLVYVEFVAGAGHNILKQMPELFVEKLEAFLTDPPKEG